MRSIQVTLPVRNLKVSAAFFAELGFTVSDGLIRPGSVSIVLDQNVHVCLLPQEHYRDRIDVDSDPAVRGGSALISLTASSKQEVDEIVMRAIVAGARPWPMLDEHPGYSGSFQDPDGHLWQVTCPPATAPRPEEFTGAAARSLAVPAQR